MVRSRPGLMVLEPRYLFDGAGAAEVAEKLLDNDPVDGGLLRLPGAPANLPAAAIDAQSQAEQLVGDFLQQPDALARLFTAFNGGQEQPSAEWLSAAESLIAGAKQGTLGVRVELRSHYELWGAYGAFAARGPDGQPVIYLNADWVNSGIATPYAVSRILVEELGHFIDYSLNGDHDTAGDEGEAFAGRILGWDGASFDLARIAGDNDRFTLTIDGRPVEAEMVALMFSVQSFFAGTTATNLTADLEQNSLLLGAALPGTRFIFVSDPASAFIYSGNNVRGTLYGIDGSNNIVCQYFGEVSRLVKTGSTVEACQFYVYPDPGAVSDPTKITTGTPATTILINIGGTFTSGQSVNTSSDPVASALNKLIAANSAPVAAADTATADEAGGIANGTAGSDPSGTVVGNDTDANTFYVVDTVNNRIIESSDTLTVTGLSNAASGASGTPGANTTSANGAVVAGVYGSLTMGANGTYRYVLNNNLAAVQALRTSSNILTEIFSYQISDGKGGVSATTLTVTIRGTNDHPTAVDDYNVAKESLAGSVDFPSVTAYSTTAGSSYDPVGTKATGNVLTNDTDPDRYNETRQVASVVATASGTTTAGATTLTFSSLPSSVSVNDYVFLDGDNTDNDLNRGTLLLDASNNPIRIQSIDTASKTLTLTGTVANASLSNNQILGFSNKSDGTGTYKDEVVAAPGTVGSVNVTLASTAGPVSAGMVVTGIGVPADTTVVSVTYDAGTGKATAVTLSNAVTLSSTSLTFTAAAGATLTGAHGTLVLNADGSYVYTPKVNNPNLSQGSSAVEEFDYRMVDAAGAVSPAKLYITVLGSGTNDPDAVADTVAAGEAGGVNNGTAGMNPNGTSGTSLLANDTPRDGGTISIVAARSDQSASDTAIPASAGGVTDAGYTAYHAKIVGQFGTLYLKSDGSYAYVVDNANATVQALRTSGQSVSETFLYTVQNSVAAKQDVTTLTIVITGANDTPVATSDTDRAVAAGGAAAAYDPSGNVLINDTDIDAGDLRAVTAIVAGNATPTTAVSASSTSISGYTTVNGTYGTLRIGADGSYVYLVNSSHPAVLALTQGQLLTSPEVFTYEVTDAGGLTTIATLTIDIEGNNSPPVNAYPASVKFQQNTTFSFTGGSSISVGEPDNNLDTVNLAVTHGTLFVSEAGSTYDATNGVRTLAGGAKIYYIAGSGSPTTYTNPNGTSSLTLSGTRDQINAALASLQYTPDLNYAGSDSLTITSIDTGGLQDADVVPITSLALGVTAYGPVNEASSYAMFRVTGTVGEMLSLTLGSTATTTDRDATISGFTVMQYSVDGGANWITYVVGTAQPVVPASGKVYVRVAITSEADSTYEGPETFTLTAAISSGSGATAVDTATIVDDGSGTKYPGTIEGSGEPTPVTTDLDDDRALTVTSPTVNEASPYAVFTVDGEAGQLVSLALANGTAGAADYGASLEYSVDGGTTWTTYTAGTIALTGTGGTALVRTPVKQDSTYEGGETFTLTATPTGGTAAVGTATIKDDGTGDIFRPNGTLDPSTAKDDDRALTVTSPTVNEASPYAVFTVTGTAGRVVSLQTIETAGAGFADLDQSFPLQIWNGTAWVNYSGSTTIPASGILLVRVNILAEQDAANEVAETFQLRVTPTTGAAATGVATIVDEANGVIFTDVVRNNAPETSTQNLDDDRDIDGIPARTEDVLAQVGGGTPDLNGDGKTDSEQNALATLAWVVKANFDTSLNPATVANTPPTSIITLGVATASGTNTVDASAQLLEVAVLEPNPAAYPPGATGYAGGKPTGPLMETPWDPLQFTVRPASGYNSVADANTARAGLQLVIRIDVSRSNLPGDYFNAYLKFVSAEVIAAAGSAGLRGLDGNLITTPGWYDFTQKKDAAGNYVGDGGRFIVVNGKIVAIELTITDNAFGDNNPAIGVITDPGMPVRVRTVPPSLPDNAAWADLLRPGLARFDDSEITRTPLRFDSALLGVHGTRTLDRLDGLEALFANAAREIALAEFPSSPAWRAVAMPSATGHLSVLRGLPDQVLVPAAMQRIEIPSDAFAVSGPTSVVLSATVADGSPLPAWIQFDARGGVFSCQVPMGIRGEIPIRVEAATVDQRVATCFRMQIESARAAWVRPGFTEQLRGAARTRELVRG